MKRLFFHAAIGSVIPAAGCLINGVLYAITGSVEHGLSASPIVAVVVVLLLFMPAGVLQHRWPIPLRLQAAFVGSGWLLIAMLTSVAVRPLFPSTGFDSLPVRHGGVRMLLYIWLTAVPVVVHRMLSARRSLPNP